MEMQIKIMSYHYISIGKLKLQRKAKPSVGEDVVWQELSYTAEINVKQHHRKQFGIC